MSALADDYAIVVGNSHARTFAACRSFLPIFIGPGREFCFIDDATGAVIRERVAELLATLGEQRPLLLVLSEPEIRFHLESGGKCDEASDGRFAADVASRYAAFLATVRGCWRSPIAVLGSIPRSDSVYCRLAARVNAALGEICRVADVAFVDLWPDCVDAETGVLKPGLDADGIHMGFDAAPIVARRLQMLDLLPPTGLDIGSYRLADRHEFKLRSGNIARVWGDLRLQEPSEAKASTATARQLADALLPKLSSGDRVAVVGAKDGYLAFQLSQRLPLRVVAVEQDEERRSMAERLARAFAGVAPVAIVPSMPHGEFDALVFLRDPSREELGAWLANPKTASHTLMPSSSWAAVSNGLSPTGRASETVRISDGSADDYVLLSSAEQS